MPFLGIFGLKIKFGGLFWNSVQSLTQIYRSQWWCLFVFCLRLEILFLSIVGPKNQNYHFKLNMKNSMARFIFPVFDKKYPFLEKLFLKIKIVCSAWMVILIFFLDRKYLFSVNLVRIFKIVSLSWNLVLRLFRICKWDGDVHFFCFRPIFASFVQKTYLAFWFYLINFRAVYSQRPDANDFLATNNLDSVLVFTVYSFQHCQEMREPLLINNAIARRLSWQFWIFSNTLGKKLITKFILYYLCDTSRQRYSNTLRTSLLGRFWLCMASDSINMPIFCEPVKTEFCSQDIFYPFLENLVQKHELSI